MSWYSGLEPICRADVPLAEHTWYGLGGPARWFFTPRDEAELADVLRRSRDAGIAARVLGRGANVLVRDEGVDGVVIALTEPYWTRMIFEDALVHAGAGVDFTKLVKRSVDLGLGGLENLAGIPGTVGGIVRMNAGGKHGSISTYVRRVRLMRRDGTVEERSRDQMGFTYRHSEVGDAVVLSAVLQLDPADREALADRFRRIWTEKAASQPAVSARSCGCIFKNPPGSAAGLLIDQAGLKGERSGGAEIARQHANFILAYPGARSSDVLALIERARERVRARSGIELELEVEVW